MIFHDFSPKKKLGYVIYIYIYQGSDKGGGVMQMVLVDTKRNA